MLRCIDCDALFDSEDEAMDHIQSEHTDDIDNELMEYLSEAKDTVYDNLIEKDDIEE